MTYKIFQILFAMVHHFQRRSGIITSGFSFVANVIVTLSSLIILFDAQLYNGPMYSGIEVFNACLIALCSTSLFILSCFADDAVDAGLRPPFTKTKQTLLENSNEFESFKEEKVVNVSPRVYSSFLSRITLFWYTEFFQILSKKKTLEPNDLWQLDEESQMKNISYNFNWEFNKEMEHVSRLSRTSSKPVKFNSWNTIRFAWRFCGKSILFTNLLKLVSDLITFLRPVLMSYMIQFISDPEEKKWHGILLVIGFVVHSIFQKIFNQFFYEQQNRITTNLWAGMKNLLYCKATSISNKARNKLTIGKIINLIGEDAGTLSNLPDIFETLWSSPFQISECFLTLKLSVLNISLYNLKTLMIKIFTEQSSGLTFFTSKWEKVSFLVGWSWFCRC